MGVGRFFCVALPLILTVGSIVTLLYATLAGISHERLHLFRLNVTDLSISPLDAGNLADKFIGLGPRATATTKTSNITAADLGLDDYYDVTLWGFCSTSSKGNRTCSPHQFDWATKELSTSNMTTSGGVTVQLPKDIRDAITAFQAVNKSAEIVFIVALIALGIEFVVGFFSNFSRIISCLTYCESTFATFLVCAAAGLATALSLIVVGIVDSTAKYYGVHASFDKNMLAVVWISAAFSVAASLFWILTVCCCKPEKRSRNHGLRGLEGDNEKLLSNGFGGFMSRKYEPLDGHRNTMTAPPNNPSVNARTDLAYEPYSHRV